MFKSHFNDIYKKLYKERNIYDGKKAGQSDFAKNTKLKEQKRPSKINYDKKVAEYPSDSFRKAGS